MKEERIKKNIKNNFYFCHQHWFRLCRILLTHFSICIGVKTFKCFSFGFISVVPYSHSFVHVRFFYSLLVRSELFDSSNFTDARILFRNLFENSFSDSNICVSKKIYMRTDGNVENDVHHHR